MFQISLFPLANCRFFSFAMNICFRNQSLKAIKKAIIIPMQDCSDPVRFIAFSLTTSLYFYFCTCFVRANGYCKRENNFKEDLFSTNGRIAKTTFLAHPSQIHWVIHYCQHLTKDFFIAMFLYIKKNKLNQTNLLLLRITSRS